MPEKKSVIEQIFGRFLPKQKAVKPRNFMEGYLTEYNLVDEPVEVAEPVPKRQIQFGLSDVEMEALPTALRTVDDEEGALPYYLKETKYTGELDTTVETGEQKFARETSEFMKSPEFSYMLAALGASIGGKDSVGEKLGGFAIEQLQSSIYEDYRSALEAGEDVSKIPGVNLLPVAMKSQALKEKRAETELGFKEKELEISEKATGTLSKFRDASTQKLYSDIERGLPELEKLQFQRGTKMMEMEMRLEQIVTKGEIDTKGYANQIKLYDRMAKAVDEKVRDKEGVMHRLTPGETSKLRQKFWQEELLQSEGMSVEWHRLQFQDLSEDPKKNIKGEMYMAVKDGKWVIVEITAEAPGYRVVKELQ